MFSYKISSKKGLIQNKSSTFKQQQLIEEDICFWLKITVVQQKQLVTLA